MVMVLSPNGRAWPIAQPLSRLSMAGKASSQNAGILAGVPSSPRIRLRIVRKPRVVCCRALGALRCITNLAVHSG
jgi:hypothetical protein